MAREYFHAYHSYLEALAPLSNAERGRLFTALLVYSRTGEAPELRGNERFVFPSLRWQLDRDNEAYAEKCERNRKNGALGGKASGGVRFSGTANASHHKQTPPKEKEREKEKEKAKEKGSSGKPDPRAEEIAQVVDYLNGRLGTHYRAAAETTAGPIRARLAEGLTVAQLQQAVDNKCADWNHAPDPGCKDMRPYLRPETLFGPKCESYVNEVHERAWSARNILSGGPRRAPVFQEGKHGIR